MSEQDKNSDIVVVAREGYSVLLEIDGRMFDIDCHESVNLSKIFPVDVLERCSSLTTHLEDGNLIRFEDGIKLSVDTTATAEIKPLHEEAVQHIMSQYDQTEKDINRTNMELETRANITENTCKHIQKQVQASKEAILNTDRKIPNKTVQTVDDAVAPFKERRTAMTADELSMGVTMDINKEEFAKKQAEAKVKFDADEEVDEARAQNEIDKQEAENAE